MHRNILADSLSKLDQNPESIAAFKKTIDADPRNVEALNHLALLYQKLGRFDEAFANYRKALAIQPNDAQTHFNVGNCWHDQNRYDEAAASYRKAIEVDPKNAKAYSGLGNTLREQRKAKEAVDVYRKFVELDPTNHESFYALGFDLSELNEWPEAEKAYAKAIELQPDSAKAHGGLAKSLHWQGQFAKSVAAYEKAFALAPPGHALHGYYEHFLGQEKAILGLEGRLAKKLDGKYAASPEEVYNMGELCGKLKAEYVLAVRLFKEAFDARPDMFAKIHAKFPYLAGHAAAQAYAELDKTTKIAADEKQKFQRLSRDWVNEDLRLHAAEAQKGEYEAIVKAVDFLPRMAKEKSYAPLRDPEMLKTLPEEDRREWEKLWKVANEVAQQARRGFRETATTGTLTPSETTKTQTVKMTPGKHYIVDYESSDFYPYLKIESLGGKVMAEKRDDNENPHNVHLSFLLPDGFDSTYVFVLSSYNRRGTGTYLLRLCASSRRLD